MKQKRRAVKLNALVLTFDDGPGSRLTPAILHVLAENNAKATFFLLGRNIKGREAIVKSIKAGGHEICSHGYEHLHYWRVSPIRAIRDIRRGWQAINAALGVNKRKYPFRPPYGKLNIFCLLYLWICQVPIIYWSADIGDTWILKFSSQRTIFATETKGGSVLLAHDFDRGDDSIDKPILETVWTVLGTAKQMGMPILTVSDFLCQCR